MLAGLKDHAWSLEEFGGIIGQQSTTNRGMINKKNTGRAFGVLLAIMYGSLTTATLHRFWPALRGLTWLIFAGLCVGIYFAGYWVLVDRPAELNRKFPISGKELRRRKREFYDWLDSLGQP